MVIFFRFQLEEKSIELEGARARVRQLEGGRRAASADSLERRSRDAHCSMRDMQPLHIPDERSVEGAEGTEGAEGEDSRIGDTPRRRPSRIPLHTAHKGAAPRPPPPPRPPSAHSVRSARSAASSRSRTSPAAPAARKEPKSAVPVRRSPTTHDNKVRARSFWNSWFFKDSGS